MRASAVQRGAHPSEAQIRQNVTEYCILPLGSAFVRSKAPFVKSLLLYGPKGCGKTLLAQAVANHTGAVFLNLSPSNLEGKFPEKNGLAKLMHMAFAVARAPQLGPAVIYLDEVETAHAFRPFFEDESGFPSLAKLERFLEVRSVRGSIRAALRHSNAALSACGAVLFVLAFGHALLELR